MPITIYDAAKRLEFLAKPDNWRRQMVEVWAGIGRHYRQDAVGAGTCAECDTLGFQRTDYGTSETCVGYFSPDGHDHDDNCVVRVYECIECHRQWRVSIRRTCPACDWRGKDYCFCHPGRKVDEWP